MRIGDRVFWEDSDADGNRGIGTVVSLEYEPVDDGTLIGIDMDDGSFVEAFRHELKMEHGWPVWLVNHGDSMDSGSRSPQATAS